MNRYLLCFLLLIAACSRIDEVKHHAIRIGGSSTVYPIAELAVNNYMADNPDVQFRVEISGTSGGFEKFCKGEIEIANASRPITTAEQKQCGENGVRFLETPVALDGIAIVVHPGNNWVNYLTTDELKALWEPGAERKVTKWSQIRPEWPDRVIRLYGPGSASGTYDHFVESILGDKNVSRGDYVATENDNVLVQGVANDTNSLGIFGLAYYQTNFYALKLVPIDDRERDNGHGPVIPSLETVKNGTYQPFSRSIYMYVSHKALERDNVSDFLQYYLRHAREIAHEAGYIPQPQEIYTSNIDSISALRLR